MLDARDLKVELGSPLKLYENKYGIFSTLSLLRPLGVFAQFYTECLLLWYLVIGIDRF